MDQILTPQAHEQAQDLAMSPPPVTPSPHRFVSTAKDPNQAPSVHAQQPQTSHPRASQQQFVPTPRFSFASAKQHVPAGDPSQSSSSPFIPRRLLQQPIFSKRRGEDIEEASSDRETHEARDASEPFIHNAPDTTQGTTLVPLSAFGSLPTLKRRRLIPPTPHELISISSSSSSPSSSPPSTPPNPATLPPHHPPATTLPRFIPTVPPSPSLPTRPHFLLPPSPPPPPTLPPAFSPHRRGAKYISAGLAATVLEWVLEASQASHNHARSRSSDDSATWDFAVVVEECNRSARMLLVRERGTGRGWVFAGSGSGGGEGLRSGCVIRVRRPVWEVEVGEERWGVGVEWSVVWEG